MSSEHLQKRFGVVAIEHGFVSPEQFVEALKIQVMEDVKSGKHRLVGRILLENGAMSLEQINIVLDAIGKGIPLLKEEQT